jgi:hypothetical protein
VRTRWFSTRQGWTLSKRITDRIALLFVTQFASQIFLRWFITDRLMVRIYLESRLKAFEIKDILDTPENEMCFPPY